MPAQIKHIAVGVDGYPEGHDAATLASALAHATGADLMLVAIHPEPVVVLPSGMDWKSVHRQAEAALVLARDTHAAGARVVIETDLSVPRGLERVMRREHRDLLVVGSSRRAHPGSVGIGKRTRQLLCHFECALAIAPRGLSEGSEPTFARIGVGYDGGPESDAALALAGSIARAAGAELIVRTVVDDRVPAVAWSDLPGGLAISNWEEVIEADLERLRAQATARARATGARARVEALRGRPADALLHLDGEFDLLVIGSRRWGPVARVLLGSTGEALLQHAHCPVLVVPRPHAG